MTTWDASLDDRSRDAEKAKRLANALANLPGDPNRKLKFLTANMAKMEANAALRLQQQGIDGDVDEKAMGRAMVSIAFSYWKAHVREYMREHPQEQGPRSGKMERVSFDIIKGGK